MRVRGLALGQQSGRGPGG